MNSPSEPQRRRGASTWTIPRIQCRSFLPDRAHRLFASASKRARDNAHQVAPLEIITALNGLLVRLDDFDMTLANPSTLHAFTTQMLAQMADAFAIVEDVWFKREDLSEEELRQRFLQQ